MRQRGLRKQAMFPVPERCWPLQPRRCGAEWVAGAYLLLQSRQIRATFGQHVPGHGVQVAICRNRWRSQKTWSGVWTYIYTGWHPLATKMVWSRQSHHSHMLGLDAHLGRKRRGCAIPLEWLLLRTGITRHTAEDFR